MGVFFFIGFWCNIQKLYIWLLVHRGFMDWIDFSKTITQRLDRLNLDKTQIKIRGGKLDAHSLVRGVAGSGKSVLLRKRIDRIKNEHIEYNVLVLTYNRFMAGWIKDIISSSTSSEMSIKCCTFHSWAWHELKYNYKSSELDFLEKINFCKKKYDAILIDEAQDFKDEWFLGLLKLLNPDTNSLFIVYDNTQSVYGNPHRRKSDWSWTNLGIKIVGRTDILEVNYRNSPEIGFVSWDFFLPYINRAKVPISRDSAGAIIKPKFKKCRSSGVSVKLYQCTDFNLIAKEVFKALSKHPKSSIAIMMHPKIRKNIQEKISSALNALEIKNHAPEKSENRNGNIITRPCVVIDSWNSLKGLEFDAVILVNIDYVNSFFNSDDEFEEFSGLYTAMTRARDHLVILYEDNNSLIKEIESSIENTNKELTIK